MRKAIMVACAFGLSISALAAPAARPALSNQPLFSAGSVIDVDPAGTTEEAVLFEALRNLIERFGIMGVHYPDKSVRMNLTLTAEEAETALLSSYEQLAEIGSAAVDNELAQRSDDDAAQVIGAFNTVFERTLKAAPACPLMAGSKFVPTTSKKVKALPKKANVSWAQALSCLPGAKTMPLAAKSYNRKAVKATAPITRGEFLHKLNEAIEASYAEISLAGS